MNAISTELHQDVRRILATDDAELERAIARLDKLRYLAQLRRIVAELDARYTRERLDAEQRMATVAAELAQLEAGRAPS